MMTSSEVFDAIEEIAGVSGKKDKEALIAKHGQDINFMNVIEAALDPFTTYGIQNVPVRTSDAVGGLCMDGISGFGLLRQLASRELSGNAARDAVLEALNQLDAKSAELLTRIIKKDLRAGFGASTVNKVFKGTIATFPYMRCSLPKDTDLSKWNWGRGVISQEKADGMFVNINCERGGVVALTSRQGTPIPLDELSPLVEAIRFSIPVNTQTHGELLVRSPDGKECAREIGNGMLNSVAQGGKLEEGYVVICKIWDCIPLEEVKPKARYKKPYIERLMTLLRRIPTAAANSAALPRLSVIDTRVVHSLEEAYAHYRELLVKGKEGTVIKQKTAIWGDYTSKEQVKLKLEAVVDLICVGVNPGRQGTKNEGRAGALAMRSSCGLLEVDVTIKNEAMRDAVDADPEDYIGKIYPIVSNSVMKPSKDGKTHSLFLPRMAEAGYRTDKDDADSLEQIIKQFDSAIAAG